MQQAIAACCVSAAEKAKLQLYKWKNQQEIFISSPIASKEPSGIPQAAIPKQMWLQ